jgi:hypothetical protein
MFNDLREFLDRLESKGQLARITTLVSRDLEITEVADRVAKAPPSGIAPSCSRAFRASTFPWRSISWAVPNAWRGLWAWRIWASSRSAWARSSISDFRTGWAA